MDIKPNKAMLASSIANRLENESYELFANVLPNPDKILRDAGIRNQALEDVLADPHVFSLVQTRNAGSLAYEWDIDRGKAKSKQTEIVKRYFYNAKVATLIKEILKAKMFGFQPIEVTWSDVGGVWLPRWVGAKPREWFSFDKNGNMLYHDKEYQEPKLVRRNDAKEPEPDEVMYKFLCPRNNPTFENPYGEAVLSRVWWNYIFKKEGKRMWAVFCELFGTPWTIAQYPTAIQDDADKVTAFHNAIVSMVQSKVVTVPEGHDAKYLAANISGTADLFERFIKDARTENTMAILGHDALSSSTPGKLGADNTAMEVASWVVKDDKSLIEETLNELIQWIYVVNGWSGEVPYFQMYKPDSVDYSVVASMVSTLSGAGVQFTKKFYMDKFGFADDDIEVGAPTPVAQFASNGGQENIDSATNAYIADADTNNAALEPLTTLVQDFVSGKSTFEEAMNNIHTIFADGDTSKLEEVMYKMQAVGMLQGVLSSKEEDSND